MKHKIPRVAARFPAFWLILTVYLLEFGVPGPGQCLISSGGLSAGLEYPSLRLAVLTDTQIMGAGLRRQKRRQRR